jgi:hypothetical protein
MAEARRLKNGRWRLYKTPGLSPIKDPETGATLSFESFPEARRWWRRRYPDQPPPDEGIKCAKCGGYLGPKSSLTLVGGLYYHVSHSPEFRRPRTQR